MPEAHPNEDKITEHFAEILNLLGLNAEEDPELQGTPRRVAEFWASQFRGVGKAEAPVIKVLPSSGDQEDMVMVRDIPFHSACAHHLSAFFGHATIAYIPGESLIGIGTPARVLHYFAARPQLQERMGEQVATYITRAIEPRGVMVHISGRHLCMEMRGPRSPGVVETTATRGWFSDQEWRAEFYGRLNRRVGP